MNCPPCPERLPSCIGMPDGVNVFTGREWKPDYVVCFKNRTMEIKKCKTGFYHPVKQTCTEIVDHGKHFKSNFAFENYLNFRVS